MKRTAQQHLETYKEIRAILAEFGPGLSTVQHDLFNTMQTILSSVEILNMKEHEQLVKDSIIDRMNTGAVHFEAQLKYLLLQCQSLRSDLEKKIAVAEDAADQIED
jgi:hypothetical protein